MELKGGSVMQYRLLEYTPLQMQAFINDTTRFMMSKYSRATLQAHGVVMNVLNATEVLFRTTLKDTYGDGPLPPGVYRQPKGVYDGQVFTLWFYKPSNHVGVQTGVERLDTHQDEFTTSLVHEILEVALKHKVIDTYRSSSHNEQRLTRDERALRRERWLAGVVLPGEIR
jgi:hypothetical protein